eukprot:5224867-Pleurochrysis_carterae.AAC.1
MCLECGGRLRRWRPDVRALRVAISALADVDTCRSTGEASGHVGGRVGGSAVAHVEAGCVNGGTESTWVRRRPLRRGHGA